MTSARVWSLAALGVCSIACAQPETYRQPAQALIELVDAPSAVELSLSPNRNLALLYTQPRLRTLAELAEPELRLAGIRISPLRSERSRTAYAAELRLKSFADLREREIRALPPTGRVRRFAWSPDSQHLAV